MGWHFSKWRPKSGLESLLSILQFQSEFSYIPFIACQTWTPTFHADQILQTCLNNLVLRLFTMETQNSSNNSNNSSRLPVSLSFLRI